MLSPLEIFRQMVTTDAQYQKFIFPGLLITSHPALLLLINNSQTNWVLLKELIAHSRMNQQNPKPSYNKIEEWQKQQDQLALQLNHQKPQMYVPVYPIRRQFDLKARFDQHNLSLNMSLENKLQRTPSYIPHILDSQIMSDLSDPQMTRPKLDDDTKKKSNLKSNSNKTVEKKSVKIEEKRKSQSEAKKGTAEKPAKKSDDTKSPKKSDKPPKAPKAGEKTLKKDKSNSSMTKSPKKSKDNKGDALTVDSYLKNAKKKA